MLDKLRQLGEQSLKEVAACGTLEALELFRVNVLGKKGSLSEILKALGSVGPEERPKIGAAANELKRKIETALEERKATLESAELERKLASERIDISLPARKLHAGKLHPVTTTFERIVEVFSRIGFDLRTGPEVESEYLTFDAVNVVKDHPARDMQDTFFLAPGVVLRTHTTPVQMRAMLERPWPIRVLAPGAVYRRDDDATHSPMFHQLEGLWIDENVTMADLKGTLEFFARELFGSGTKIRLRPSYFPFTEPSAEVDVSCYQCRVKPSDSCKICRGSGWLECLGAGMVHPNLFKTAGYDMTGARKPTGFAFGLGIDRIAMLLHEIPDLRLMFQGDARFLNLF